MLLKKWCKSYVLKLNISPIPRTIIWQRRSPASSARSWSKEARTLIRVGELLTEFPLVHQIQGDADLVSGVVIIHNLIIKSLWANTWWFWRASPGWAPTGRRRSWEGWRRGSSGSFVSSVHSLEAPQLLAWMVVNIKLQIHDMIVDDQDRQRPAEIMNVIQFFSKIQSIKSSPAESEPLKWG